MSFAEEEAEILLGMKRSLERSAQERREWEKEEAERAKARIEQEVFKSTLPYTAC
jgi:hypothetical protein